MKRELKQPKELPSEDEMLTALTVIGAAKDRLTGYPIFGPEAQDIASEAVWRAYVRVRDKGKTWSVPYVWSIARSIRAKSLKTLAGHLTVRLGDEEWLDDASTTTVERAAARSEAMTVQSQQEIRATLHQITERCPELVSDILSEDTGSKATMRRFRARSKLKAAMRV